jgi:tripartite-type tricarboxylate transporter receptor subunit TctC
MVTPMLVGMLSAKSARAQGYPTKPIEIVVPWGAGTGADIMGRVIADIGSKYLSQPMVVINKPGAAASIGAADVIASKPDGYKILVSVQHYFACSIHTQKIPFDPHDLVPLAGFLEMRQGMIVRADSPFKTFGDLLNYARKNPGQLKWANPGRGVSSYMATMLIFRKEGVNTIEVPYKGGSLEALTALMGGHVDMACVAGTIGSDQVKAGKLRLLMSFSDQRSPDFPNVPTAAELGYPDTVLPVYQGFFIHKNTPDHIKKILIDTCKKIYNDPAFKKGVASIDADPRWCGPEFINEQIKRSEAIGVPILKELGLYVEK